MTGTGRKYFDSALRVALGAATVLGSSYVLSRIKERQAMETRIDRLEQMIEALSVSDGKPAENVQKEEP
jgi:hypothetical protein